MVFSGIPFLFFFLPLFLALYYAVPFRLKNTVLLFFSLIFYAWGEPVCILLMLAVSFVDYCAGMLMERFGETKRVRGAVLFAAAAADLSLLGFFKYADLFVRTVNALSGASFQEPHVALPIGISFFTFQSLSYSIDRFRGHVETERNYFTYLTYVSMFPQLIAGPIVRYASVRRELHGRKTGLQGFSNGTVRFMQGLFRKVLVANSIGALWEEIRAAASVSAATAWLGALLFTLQLYYDFSAYSDMAIGLGEMLGFRFPENFNYPLSSVSVTDFWRRWHISLSTWFRDYVYIPLGGNRHGAARQLRNMFIVWFLTGLWHGASWNFVLWGLYYGVLLALEKFVWGRALERLPRFLRHAYAVLIIVFGFVIFVFDDMGELASYIRKMFCLAGNAPAGEEFLWYAGTHLPLILTAAVLSFPVWPALKGRLEKSGGAAGKIFRAAGFVLFPLLLILTTACLVNDTYNPFLYFRF